MAILGQADKANILLYPLHMRGGPYAVLAMHPQIRTVWHVFSSHACYNVVPYPYVAFC